MSEWLSGDFRKDLNKEYLGHWDLPEGEDFVVTIEGVKMGTVKNQRGSETKPILYFKENVKPLILNVVNQKSITKALGSPKREVWRGKKIALFEGKEPRSDDGLAVRIRDYPPRVTVEYCEECGSEIERHGDYSVNKIVTMTKAKYGRALCWDCALKAKEEHNGGQTSGTMESEQ